MKFFFGLALGAVGMWAYTSGKLQGVMGGASEATQQAWQPAAERIGQVAHSEQVKQAVSTVQEGMRSAQDRVQSVQASSQSAQASAQSTSDSSPSPQNGGGSAHEATQSTGDSGHSAQAGKRSKTEIVTPTAAEVAGRPSAPLPNAEG